MSNQKFSVNPSRHTLLYIKFVSLTLAAAGAVCAGLYVNAFGMASCEMSRFLADELLCSMIRSFSAAAIFSFAIEYVSSGRA